MRRRGFTLIELLVAATIGLIVISSVVGVSLTFQSMSLGQQQKLIAQQLLRSASDQIGLELMKAGSGLGNVRLSLGGAVTQGAIVPTTADPFTADPTFELPAAGYATLPSDSLTLYSGQTGGLVSLACCPGFGTGVCGSCAVRNATGICTTVTAGYDAGSALVYINPTLGVACGQQLTVAPSANTLVSNPGLGLLGTPPVGDPCNPGSTFWCSTGTYAMQLSAETFRVNWKPVNAGDPQRPRLQIDPDGPLGPQPFQDLLYDVEQLQVRLIIDNLTSPGSYSFYPDAVAGRPSFDQCTVATCPIIGGTDLRDVSLAAGLSATDALRAQLERRIRGVEVTLLSRSTGVDRAKIQPLSTGFVLDGDGLPLDGRSRRRLVFSVSPRNFALVEAAQ